MREPRDPSEVASSLEARLGAHGAFVVRADWRPGATHWEIAERIAESTPRMVERQIVRPVPDGRSIASTQGEAPLHADLQLFLGRPADLQVMICERAAADGGASLLLDTWPLLDRIERADPELFQRLFREVRRLPYVAGFVECPTVAAFGDRVAFVHSPQIVQGDEIGERVRAHLAASAPREIRVEAGEVLVVDNHRVLHGRRAFRDPERRFTRLLVWLRARWPPPERLSRAVRELGSPRSLDAIGAEAEDRLGLVLRVLAGVSPGVVAARANVPEPWIYELRDAALRGALEALGVDAITRTPGPRGPRGPAGTS